MWKVWTALLCKIAGYWREKGGFGARKDGQNGAEKCETWESEVG